MDLKMTTHDTEKGGPGMELRVEVNQDFCISSGKCVADEPRVFRFDDEEVAEPTGTTAGVDRDWLFDVARNCPSGAISLHGPEGPIALD